MPQSTMSQISPGKQHITPVNLHSYRPQQHQSPTTSQSLCLIPSTSTANISRVVTAPASSTPPANITQTTTTSRSTTRKRKEEPLSATINYEKDFLCYECGDFFSDETLLEDHKSYHSFARISLRMHVEQERKDVILPEFEMPLQGEEEKEFIKLRSEQVGKKKENASEFHNTALNPGLHQNHNFAINSTVLDKRPAVKVFNLKTGARITQDREQPPPKTRKCYFTGDLDNPIGYDETLSMKEYMQKRLAEAYKKPIAFKPGEVITLDD